MAGGIRLDDLHAVVELDPLSGIRLDNLHAVVELVPAGGIRLDDLHAIIETRLWAGLVIDNLHVIIETDHPLDATISEVYPWQAGNTFDATLRGEAGGRHASYIELHYSGGAKVLAGYELKVKDGDGTEVCDFTFPADGWIDTCLVLWWDDISDMSEDMPTTGTVELYDAGAALVSSFAYSTPDADEAWRADGSGAPTPGD